MADTETTDINKKVEDELTVGKFAGQQFRTLLFNAGGLLGGLGLGYFIAKKTPFRDKLASWISRGAEYFKKPNAADQVGVTQVIAQGLHELSEHPTPLITIVGGGLGSAMGGTASMYEHWSEVQGQRERIKQINSHVENVMKCRAGFEQTLENQHAVIQKLLAERQKAPGDINHLQEQLDRRAENATQDKKEEMSRK